MARKTRRAHSKRPRLSATQLAQPGTSAPVTRQKAESTAPAAPVLSDLREEYHYVLRDLKTIGLIAVAMVVVMVVVLLLI
jgi:hypothetical protein